MEVLWIVLGVVLAVSELFVATFVLVMLAAGAFAAAIAAALGAPVAVQAAVFAVVSALALFAVRPALRRRAGRDDDVTADGGLTAIEGSVAVVLEEVGTEAGLIKIDGEMWSARAYDATQVLEPGERVRVIEVRGATAWVWRE